MQMKVDNNSYIKFLKEVAETAEDNRDLKVIRSYAWIMLQTVEMTARLHDQIAKKDDKLLKAIHELTKEVKKLNSNLDKLVTTQQTLEHYTKTAKERLELLIKKTSED